MMMKTKLTLLVFCLMAALIIAPAWAADTPAVTEPSGGEAEGQSLTEVNKKLTNPVSEIWSIAFQQNNYKISTLDGFSDRWSYNLNFQPVMPIALTKNWNLITRPVVTVLSQTPYPTLHVNSVTLQPKVEMERTTAFGDTVLLEMLSPGPSISGNWLLGLGPTFIFPTAASDQTGQGKYQFGPGALVGYLSHKWILGVFVQNWSSFAGDSDRPNTNQMNLQPIASYFLPGGWSVGYSGNILANWRATDPSDTWTVPIGIAISKVVKFGRLPVKLQLAGQWMPIHPENFGQKWNIQVQIVPVIPKLIKGTLFD